jgi:hypothetical protein
MNNTDAPYTGRLSASHKILDIAFESDDHEWKARIEAAIEELRSAKD